MYDLVDGSSVSDCPLPCQTTQTEAKFLYEYEDKDTHIDITFSSKVRVTTTDLVKPTLSSFLSEVGLKFIKNVTKTKRKLCQVGGSIYEICDKNQKKTSSGWRLNGTLAWSWSSSSFSALSGFPPVGHP